MSRLGKLQLPFCGSAIRPFSIFLPMRRWIHRKIIVLVCDKSRHSRKVLIRLQAWEWDLFGPPWEPACCRNSGGNQLPIQFYNGIAVTILGLGEHRSNVHPPLPWDLLLAKHCHLRYPDCLRARCSFHGKLQSPQRLNQVRNMGNQCNASAFCYAIVNGCFCLTQRHAKTYVNSFTKGQIETGDDIHAE